MGSHPSDLGTRLGENIESILDGVIGFAGRAVSTILDVCFRPRKLAEAMATTPGDQRYARPLTLLAVCSVSGIALGKKVIYGDKAPPPITFLGKLAEIESMISKI